MYASIRCKKVASDLGAAAEGLELETGGTIEPWLWPCGLEAEDAIDALTGEESILMDAPLCSG